MTEWWQNLEAQGRVGGWIGLVVSLALLGGAVALAIYPSTAGWGLWASAGPRFLAAMLLVFALPGLFASARLLTAPVYPSASSVFPSLPRAEFERAVRDREEPICACSRCRVIVPAAFSTGSCPVCASSIDYQDVRNDEDADLVIAAI
ncbi:MAG: hypothetical protein AAF602_00070 [Myxococcota bacterium]